MIPQRRKKTRALSPLGVEPQSLQEIPTAPLVWGGAASKLPRASACLLGPRVPLGWSEDFNSVIV